MAGGFKKLKLVRQPGGLGINLWQFVANNVSYYFNCKVYSFVVKFLDPDLELDPIRMETNAGP
jgi:hypothetical protein